MVSMLAMKYVYSDEIVVPFPIASMEAVCDGALTDCLRVLFPAKARCFAKRDARRLVVSALPGACFGPAPERLASLLLGDVDDALLWAKKRFGLERITVLGFPARRSAPAPGIVFEGKARARQAGIRLDLPELGRLVAAARDGSYRPGIVVDIWSDGGRVHSFFVPEGTALGKVLDLLPGRTGTGRAGSVPVLFHPFTGERFRGDSVLTGVMSLALVSEDSSDIPAPAGSGLLAFPWFGRRIRMSPEDAAPVRERPCSNCLACEAHCPSGLHPSILYHQISRGSPHDARGLDIRSCIRCGICSFVCPSGLELAETIVGALRLLEEDSDEDRVPEIS